MSTLISLYSLFFFYLKKKKKLKERKNVFSGNWLFGKINPRYETVDTALTPVVSRFASFLSYL